MKIRIVHTLIGYRVSDGQGPSDTVRIKTSRVSVFEIYMTSRYAYNLVNI